MHFEKVKLQTVKSHWQNEIDVKELPSLESLVTTT